MLKLFYLLKPLIPSNIRTGLFPTMPCSNRVLEQQPESHAVIRLWGILLASIIMRIRIYGLKYLPYPFGHVQIENTYDHIPDQNCGVGDCDQLKWKVKADIPCTEQGINKSKSNAKH